MDYFVSIENTPYCRWQIELLIESFRKHKMEDKLVIGIANSDEPQVHAYTRNLFSHERKFVHTNIGCEVGYKPLNKPYAIYLAMNNGLLGDKFAVIHSDMILLKPMDLTGPQENITFALDPVKNVGLDGFAGPYVNRILESKCIEGHPPLNVCGTLVFNRMPSIFFVQILRRMEQLIKNHADNQEHLAAAAWLLTLYEGVGLFSFRSMIIDRYMMSPFEGAHMLHYRIGVPLHFTKQHYRFDNSAIVFSMVANDPFLAIKNLPETPFIAEMQSLASVCLAANAIQEAKSA